ncbi:MAG: hypothetical protein KDK99_04085 [Verrucomicrobiales bacterium]|nr:hypothetical protein [Verrucomicrobiales bacterium]
MIECQPKSLCSWDFTANGLSSGPAAVEYDWLIEQGRIITGHMAYDVRKHGVFSGQWTLERAGEVVADARKTSAMFRSFEIAGAGVGFTVRAVSAMTRVFEITMSDQVVGRVSPVHAFTRRATIFCSDAIPQHLQLFAFWLAVITWRRAGSNNSGAAS